MVTLLRRFLVLSALMFWQGGFLFYVSIVVPVGQAEIGPDQALVTRQVTNYLNLAGAAALLLLAGDVALARDPLRRRRWLRWLCWGAMALLLAALMWLRPRLGEMVDSGLGKSSAFHAGHRWYLWLSTLQWAAAIGYTLLTLRAWQMEDTARS